MANIITNNFRVKLCLGLLLSISPALVNAEWNSGFEKLKDRVIRSLSVAPFDKNLVLVGNKGPEPGDAKVFVSRDGGISWQFLNSNKPLHPNATDVQAVAHVSESILLAGTWKHGLYRSTDGGQSFTAQPDFPSKDVRAFVQSESGPLFAATGNRGVFKSEDDGENWVQTALDSQYIWSLHSNDQGTEVLASSPNSGLYRLSDDRDNDKDSYTQILDAKVHSATASTDLKIIAAATDDGLFISNDSGGSWSQPNSFQGQKLSSVQFQQNNSEVLLISGWKTGVWEYSISTQTATEISNPLAVVHLLENDDALLAGTWGKGVHVFPSTESSNYLINATKAQDEAAVVNLLDNGMNPDGFDAQRNTALIFASRDGFTEIAKALIDNGADVNWVDGEKVTPLILASFKNHPNVVELLLANGAKQDFVDGFGKTAMDYAIKRGENDRILQMLQDN